MGSVLEKNSSRVRKRIESHTFDDEEGEEYGPSEFHGFGDYYRRKKVKLQNLDAEIRAASDKPPIFKGVVAFVNGYTQPGLEVLHKEIVQHGGGFLQYLDSKTSATHIITATLPPKKAVEFSRYRIVKPAWVVDSIKAGRLLPWADYAVLGEGASQKVLKFGSAGLTQENPADKRGYTEQTDSSFYTSRFKTGSAFVDEEPLKHGRPDTPNSPAWIPRVTVMDKSPTPRRSGSGSPFNEDVPDETLTSEAPKKMTSEEHNVWLLSDPRIRKSSTANPDFLKQYYSESRLHHLSTWKANLKSSMQRLAAKDGPSGKKTKPVPGSRQYILHVDFDSFFCAISLKKHPEYIDKPAVVAHSNGSGSEIASCNYVARKFGVRNGMWMKTAQDLCPDLKVLPYDFPAYEEASLLFYESVIGVGGVVQSVSVDEALIDATDVILSATGSRGVGIDEGSLWREQAKADEIAQALRDEVKAKTGCNVSVGIGGNVLLAKVALRKAKPAGQHQLKPEEVLDVIGELKVEELPGVAYSISGKLEEIGVKFVKDIRNISKERLSAALGPKTSDKLSDYARGIDRTGVGEQPPRKSVSAEVNWGIRFISQAEAEEFVCNLCKELEKRLVNEQLKGKHLTMKIMRRSLDAPLDPTKHLGHGKCDAFNKSAAFGVATHSHEVIAKEAVSILRSFKFSPGDLRGIGVQMTKLEPIKLNLSAPEGSQKRIAFAPHPGPSSVKKGKQSAAEPIDEAESPERAKDTDKPANVLDLDPIADDPVTPQRAKVHPAIALSRAAQSDDKAKTPLNVSGTQFLLPSNPDPYVLAQLPSDIRSKLVAQRSQPGAGPSRVATRDGSESPSPMNAPLPSQVDAEVFQALPEDMKAEILEAYTKPMPARLNQGAQPRRPAAPAPRRGGMRSILGKAQRQRDAEAGMVQTNFRAPQSMNDGFEEEEVEELDPEFLAELPEDVRKEVVADHRRRKIAQQSRLEVLARRQRASPDDGRAGAGTGGQRTIVFPVLPPQLSFVGVSSTQEIKDMLEAWYSSTRKAGPHRRDVEVLEKFLVRVIKEERDLKRAVTLVRWMSVLVEQGKGHRDWNVAMEGIKEVVQTAVKERGLTPLDIQ